MGYNSYVNNNIFQYLTREDTILKFADTVNILKNNLNISLPGRKAHLTAMPPDRKEINDDPIHIKNPRLGGVLILLYPSESGETSFPLIQRHDYKGVHGGQISLPGGKYEISDKSIYHTALRETREEIGIPENDIQIMGGLSELYIPPSHYRVTPVLGYIEYLPVFSKDPYEVKDLLQMPLQALMDQNSFKQMDMMVRGKLMKSVPYYDLNGNIIWGATAMILSELLELLNMNVN